MKSLARLKEQVKSLVNKMFMNEIDFHRLFDGMLKVVFPFISEFLHGKSEEDAGVIKLRDAAEALITRGMADGGPECILS